MPGSILGTRFSRFECNRVCSAMRGMRGRMKCGMRFPPRTLAWCLACLLLQTSLAHGVGPRAAMRSQRERCSQHHARMVRARRTLSWIRRTRRITSGPYGYNEVRATHDLEVMSGSHDTGVGLGFLGFYQLLGAGARDLCVRLTTAR